MSKKITTGMRIEAKRLGLRPEDIMLNELREAKRIDRAITTAVRKERERCVACVDDCKMVGSYAMISIIKAINGGKRGKA